MTVAVVKVSEKSARSSIFPFEVHGKHASAWLQHPSHLTGTLLACLGGEVMQHQRIQDNVEMCSGKRQRLAYRIVEDHLDPCLFRLPKSHRNHLRRRVDAMHSACGPDTPFGS